MRYAAGEIGRVNRILLRGMKNLAGDEISQAIKENRWLAGVWYARLLARDTPTLPADRLADLTGLLGPIEDALQEDSGYADSTHRAKRMYPELRELVTPWGMLELRSWETSLRSLYNLNLASWNTSELWYLVDLAMVDYRRKNRLSRVTRRWQLTSRDVALTEAICAFCGTKVGEIPRGAKPDLTRPTNKHTVPCALWFLMNDEKIAIAPGGDVSLVRSPPLNPPPT